MFDTSAAGHDFNIDNGTFVVDASANRVGIGTTTPSTLLDVNGVLTATSIAGTLTTAAQTNITSLGTLTGLTIGGNLTLSGASSPKITITDTTNTVSLLMYSQDADAIIGTYTNHPLKLFSNSSVALTFDTSQNATFAGTISGTLATAAQTNITSVGTLTSLIVSGNVGIGQTPNMKLNILHADEDGIRLNTADGNASFIDFGDASDNDIGRLSYDHADNHMAFRTNNTTALTLDSSQNATFVGAITAGGDLTIPDKIVHSGDTDTFFRFAGANDIRIVAGNVEHAAFDGTIVFNQSGADMDLRVESTGNQNILFVDAGNDRVGIGTNSPSKLLEVSSNAADVTTIKAQYNATNYLEFAHNRINAVNSGGTDFLLLQTAGANRAIVNATGLGIGTTAPAQTLAVLKTTNYNPPGLGASAGHFFFGKQDGGGAGSYGLLGGTRGTGDSWLQAQRIDGTATAYNLVLQPSGGNVGIGTQSPSTILDVNGVVGIGNARVHETRVNQTLALTTAAQRGGMSINSWYNSASGPLLDFNVSRNNTAGSHTVVQENDAVGTIIFRGDDGDEFIDSAAIEANVDAAPGNGDMPGRLVFYTSPDGTTGLQERMRINQDGRVKITTTSGANVAGGKSAGFEIGGIASGGSLLVRTPSLNSSFSSGLVIDGAYSHPLSQVNLTASGVYSGGGYEGHLYLRTMQTTSIWNSIVAKPYNLYFYTGNAERLEIDAYGPIASAASSTGNFAYNVVVNKASGGPSAPYSSSSNVTQTVTSNVSAPLEGFKTVAIINTRAYMNYVNIKTNLTSNGIMFLGHFLGYMYGYGNKEAYAGGYTHTSNSLISQYSNTLMQGTGTMTVTAYRASDGAICFKIHVGHTGYTEGQMIFRFHSHGESTTRQCTVVASQVRNDGTNHYA